MQKRSRHVKGQRGPRQLRCPGLLLAHVIHVIGRRIVVDLYTDPAGDSYTACDISAYEVAPDSNTLVAEVAWSTQLNSLNVISTFVRRCPGARQLPQRRAAAFNNPVLVTLGDRISETEARNPPAPLPR
jgi:hypothetical protein